MYRKNLCRLCQDNSSTNDVSPVMNGTMYKSRIIPEFDNFTYRCMCASYIMWSRFFVNEYCVFVKNMFFICFSFYIYSSIKINYTATVGRRPIDVVFGGYTVCILYPSCTVIPSYTDGTAFELTS